MNAFDYYINRNDFLNQRDYLKKALEFKDTDTLASIFNGFTVVTDLVNKILKSNDILPDSKIVNNIKMLSEKNIIPDNVNENLHNLRKLRNTFAAHPNEVDGKQIIADSITVTFYLKHLYEFLCWYFQKYLGIDIVFDSIDDVLTNVKLIEIEKSNSSSNLLIYDIPKFFVDNLYFKENRFAEDDISKMEPKVILDIISSFFTTNLSLNEIEEIVLNTTKYKGIVAYYIINKGNGYGITYSWRRYVHKFGIPKAIKNIEEKIEVLPDEKSLQLRNLLSILKTINKV